DRAADAQAAEAGQETIGEPARDAERDPLPGALGRRLADAADPLWAVADRLLVVPPLRAAPAVPHDPRRGADAGPRGGGAGGKPQWRSSRQPDGESAVCRGARL